MSLKVDISNYEQYAADYLDGTLNGDLLESFKAFLLTHPEIAAEIEEISEAEISLSAPAESASFKESLKINITPTASINEENYESAFALSVGERTGNPLNRELETFLTLNPALKRDHVLYGQTALTPDVSVIFEKKATLKRPIPLFENTPALFYRAAAVLVIALGAYTAFRFVQNTPAYEPRLQTGDFATLDIDTAPGQKMVADSKENDPVQHPLPDGALATAGRGKPVELLPLRTLATEEEPGIITGRELAAYHPTVPEIIPAILPAPKPSRVEELTLAQYVGKRWLGIEPEEAATPRTLLKEGVNRLLPANEDFAIENRVNNNDRHTLHILAGVFEFKRVNYKEN